MVFILGCDAYVEYTIVNDTDSPLITRPGFEECRLKTPNKLDYLEEDVVAPRGQQVYEEVFGVEQPLKCVEVLAADRAPILAEAYEYQKCVHD